jgi:spoIIIJ-associated protein
VEWVEASGKSLAEAKESALDMLGVAEDDAEFDVLSEPKAGLFGRLRGEARVKARVRPVAPPPKRTRRQRPDRKREGGGRARSGESGAKAGGERGRKDRSAGDVEGAVSTDAVPDAGSTTTSERTGGGSRRNRSRGGKPPGGNQSKQQQEQGSGRASGEREDTMEESLTLEQQGEAAQQFLSGLVREFGLDAAVSFSEVDEDTVQVAATGDDLGLLVGPRGATLAAVQDLTRTFVQRQSENRTDRILVDVGGYREKRNAALKRFAEGIVDEVKSSGDERALEPMSPADRKVIHDTVNEIDGVETRSDGVEPNRYVVIAPN